MKKLVFLALVTLAMSACKKEKQEEVVVNNNTTNPTTYAVTNYVSAIPMNSVIIHNDTLTCDATDNIYEYIKNSSSQYESSRIYWKSSENWTIWNQGAISYFSNDTLYINF